MEYPVPKAQGIKLKEKNALKIKVSEICYSILISPARTHRRKYNGSPKLYIKIWKTSFLKN